MVRLAYGPIFAPLLAATVAQTGCGTTHASGKTNGPFSINSSGGNRQYIIHVPKSYNANKATPLIVSYHGHGKTMYEQETLSQFSDETLNADMLVVYPQGLDVSSPSIIHYAQKLMDGTELVALMLRPTSPTKSSLRIS